jgi:hypothetical protein
VILERLAHAPGRRDTDALIDRQRLPQMGRRLAGVAILQVAVAESLQRACFLRRRAELAGDGQRLSVTLAGLAGVRSPGS